jgi:ParB-like chromosome segregation protein Spo0J
MADGHHENCELRGMHAFADFLHTLDIEDRIEMLNAARRILHAVSPFRNEPVDCVQWIKSEKVTANDYNPNSVAPPEMKLLEHSIQADGYTQPIVSFAHNDTHEVIDGFHRHRVGKESAVVRDRVRGYLPLVVINSARSDRSDRIAATIRHNRARGKHQVEAMSDIVIELKRRNWSDERIGRELGMDPDEVLRLCQITGLSEAFGDSEFSQAWEVEKTASAPELFSDIIEGYEPNDKGRIFHTWEKWECYQHGFYAENPPGTIEEGEENYREFLADLSRFETALQVVTSEWQHSCEHYLTNDRMNRIAWLGQASVAQSLRIPSVCRGGYTKLTETQQRAADEMALKYLNKWLADTGREVVALEAAYGRTEVDLY